MSEKTLTATDIIKGYSDYYLKLQKVKNQVEYEKNYSSKHIQEFLKILDTKQTITVKEMDFIINKKTKKNAQQNTIKLLPSDIFFIPSDENQQIEIKQKTRKTSSGTFIKKDSMIVNNGSIKVKKDIYRRASYDRQSVSSSNTATFQHTKQYESRVDPIDPWPRE